MGKQLTGVGRVSVFTFLHRWEELKTPPQGRCIMAYATTGKFGTDAVVGLIERPDLIDGCPDLMSLAARHEPGRVYTGHSHDSAKASWLICTGCSSLGRAKTGGLDLKEASWTLDLQETIALTLDPGKFMWGHSRLHVGKFSLADEALMDQARGIL